MLNLTVSELRLIEKKNKVIQMASEVCLEKSQEMYLLKRPPFCQDL